VLVYVKTAAPPNSFLVRNGELFTNWDAASIGYHLARGVCETAGFDRLEIVPNDTAAELTLVPGGTIPAQAPPGSCLNFY
jgi:hypothetical protein